MKELSGDASLPMHQIRLELGVAVTELDFVSVLDEISESELLLGFESLKYPSALFILSTSECLIRGLVMGLSIIPLILDPGEK